MFGFVSIVGFMKIYPYIFSNISSSLINSNYFVIWLILNFFRDYLFFYKVEVFNRYYPVVSCQLITNRIVYEIIKHHLITLFTFIKIWPKTDRNQPVDDPNISIRLERTRPNWCMFCFEKCSHYFHMHNLNSTYLTTIHLNALQSCNLIRVFKD